MAMDYFYRMQAEPKELALLDEGNTTQLSLNELLGFEPIKGLDTPPVEMFEKELLGFEPIKGLESPPVEMSEDELLGLDPIKGLETPPVEMSEEELLGLDPTKGLETPPVEMLEKELLGLDLFKGLDAATVEMLENELLGLDPIKGLDTLLMDDHSDLPIVPKVRSMIGCQREEENNESSGLYTSELLVKSGRMPILIIKRLKPKKGIENTVDNRERANNMYDSIKHRKRSCVLQDTTHNTLNSPTKRRKVNKKMTKTKRQNKNIKSSAVTEE